MTKSEAIAYFGTQQKLARALGCTQPNIASWKTIPLGHQNYLEKLTLGELVADPHPAEVKAKRRIRETIRAAKADNVET